MQRVVKSGETAPGLIDEARLSGVHDVRGQFASANSHAVSPGEAAADMKRSR